jgi:hypothetical protein
MSEANISAKTATQEAVVGTEYAFHPLANLFPLLEGGEFGALVEDVRARGLNEPMVLYEGKILDGRNRYRARTAAGIEPRYREMNFGSYADATAYVVSANIHRRHLTVEQRRELIEKLLKADPEQSDRQIAQTTKVSDKTVGAIRRQAEARAEIPHVEKRIDSKGRKQPAHKTVPAKSNDSVTEKVNITAGNDVDTEKSAEERRAYYAGNDADHDDAGHADGQAGEVNEAEEQEESFERRLFDHALYLIRAACTDTVTIPALTAQERCEAVDTLAECMSALQVLFEKIGGVSEPKAETLIDHWHRSTGELAALLDAIGVAAVLSAASPEFIKQLVDRLPKLGKRPHLELVANHLRNGFRPEAGKPDPQ